MFVALTRKAALTAVAAAALAACAPQQSGSVYSSSQALTASQVDFGTITGGRPVELRNAGQADQVIGMLAGGVAGAAVGQQIGDGSGQVIATGLGALAGSYAGGRAGTYVGRAQSVEWFVRLDNGQNISVVQGDQTFAVGQRVRVIQSGGQTRLVG